MSHVKSHVLWALTASIFPLGGVVGAPLVRPLVAKFGRRNTLVFVQVLQWIDYLIVDIMISVRLSFHSKTLNFVNNFLLLLLALGCLYFMPFHVAIFSTIT